MGRSRNALDTRQICPRKRTRPLALTVTTVSPSPYSMGGSVSGKGLGARQIATGWHRHTQCLVRALVVVDGAPVVERALRVVEVGEDTSRQHFGLERTVEAFVLPVGLRMSWTAEAHPHAQAYEPDREGRNAMPGARTAPGLAVIHIDPLGQAVVSERCFQHRLHLRAALSLACMQRHRVAGVVVQHGERMAALLAQRKVALEVHLPQCVGHRMFEAVITRALTRARRMQLPMPAQDVCDGARMRDIGVAQMLQTCGDLAPTPYRMRLA